MHSTMLMLTAIVLPLLWGWGVHWVVARLWPVKQTARGARPQDVGPLERPIDYQI